MPYAQTTSTLNKSLLTVADNCQKNYFDTLRDRIKLTVSIEPTDYQASLVSISGYIPQSLATQFRIDNYEPFPIVRCYLKNKPVRLPMHVATHRGLLTCVKQAGKEVPFQITTNLGNSVSILLPKVPPQAPQASTSVGRHPPPAIQCTVRTLLPAKDSTEIENSNHAVKVSKARIDIDTRCNMKMTYEAHSITGQQFVNHGGPWLLYALLGPNDGPLTEFMKVGEVTIYCSGSNEPITDIDLSRHEPRFSNEEAIDVITRATSFRLDMNSGAEGTPCQ